MELKKQVSAVQTSEADIAAHRGKFHLPRDRAKDRKRSSCDPDQCE